MGIDTGYPGFLGTHTTLVLVTKIGASLLEPLAKTLWWSILFCPSIMQGGKRKQLKPKMWGSILLMDK
jgi:hypothetical protein